LWNYELGSVAGHLVFCSVIIKPRMRAPHGAGWPLPPFCGGAGGCNGSLWDRREGLRQRERREMEAEGTK